MNIIGDFFGSSGYAMHTRCLANELNKLIPISLQTTIFEGYQRMVNDAELQMLKRPMDYDINLIITNPLYWRINCSAQINIVYLIWEGDSVPKWIIEECLNPKINKIICPSFHTQSAVFNSTKDEKILNKLVVIPHGVDLSLFKPIPVERTDNFTFLINKGFTSMEDRGGVQYGIQAYLKEFTSKDNVEMIVKINPAYGIPDIQKLFKFTENSPKITFITQNLKYNQICELYNKCDVFVSPTRAEAFNIPCLEALACGKPVITTNYGGQTDFVNKKNGWLINYKLQEVKHDLFYEGIKWATPEIKHLRKLMRESMKHKFNSNDLIKLIKDLTWQNTAKNIYSLIDNRNI